MTTLELDKLCTTFKSDILVNKIEKNTGDYPLFGAKGAVTKLNSYQQSKPYISVIKWGAGVGRAELRPAYSSIVATMLGVLPNDDVDLHWLCYLLQSMHLEQYATNAVVPNLYFKDYCNTSISVPDLDEQIKISNLLDRAQRIIDTRKQQLSTLDNLIKARFVEMFGNPIDTSLNRIPLSEYVDSIRYGTSQPPEFDDKGSYKFIRATNIKYGRIVEKDMLRISEKEAKRINKCRLHTGELIIVRSGANTGDTCVITNDYDGQYAGYDIIVSLKTDMLNPVFLNEMINIPEYMRTIVKPLTARSAQPHLNAQQVQSLPVVVADKERQNEFETFCKHVDKSKFVVQKALDKAQLLFDSLMQQYFG